LQTKVKELESEKFNITHFLRSENEKKTQEVVRLGMERTELEERYNRDRDELLEEHREKLNGDL
jgi:hypothetical protein